MRVLSSTGCKDCSGVMTERFLLGGAFQLLPVEIVLEDELFMVSFWRGVFPRMRPRCSTGSKDCRDVTKDCFLWR